MKKPVFFLLVLLLFASETFAFCGMFAVKIAPQQIANVNLFNKASQVIIARNGKHTVVTMSNDFSGPASDFAMIIPVPEVLKKDQVRVKDPSIFTRFDSYSSPRMADIYDSSPCGFVPMDGITMMDDKSEGLQKETLSVRSPKALGYQVQVKEHFQVGEYDIVILSAQESDGLERWLIDHGYKIPAGAQEVLEPYIKNGLNFLVVKVALKQQRAINTFVNLRPLQIEYNSSRFMLPIRLGMANSSGTQDLVVYALSQKGRIETTNYRTVEIPTNREIPLFVKNELLFGKFYKDLFDHTYGRSSKNNVYLEYSWDVSPSQTQKCNPCVGSPPSTNDLLQAGVNWISSNGQVEPNTRVFFTRLHVRYDRAHFPQDLVFQETPNFTRFQGKYTLHHPPSNSFQNIYGCEEGQNYLRKLKSRRADEMVELAQLTGWNTWKHKAYLTQYDQYLERGAISEPDTEGGLQHGGINLEPDGETPLALYYLFYGMLIGLPLLGWLIRRK